MIRLFIAFPIEAAVKEALGRSLAEFRPLTRAVRWVKPEQMHLTARFLGDTNPNLVEPLSAVVTETARAFGPVDAVVNRLGGFPNLHHPKVIWAGMDDSSEALFPIVERLNRALSDLKLEMDNKRFKPHLTLGRIKDPKGLSTLTDRLRQFEFEPIPIRFDTLELIHSTLTPQGPIYKRLTTGRLAERFE